MGPPRRERDSGDINPMAYQDHMGTEIQNQKGQRTTDKTMRPRLTGKRGRRAHQNQRATTAHQRQPCQCGIGGPRTQPTKPTQCPQIQKTGQRTRQIMVTRTPRDSKSPQGHEQGPERTGAKRRERKRERELDVDPKAQTPPPARICLKRGKSHPANNPSKAWTNPRKLPWRMRHHTAQGQKEEGQA